MSSGAFEDLALETSMRRARSGSEAAPTSDSDFVRNMPNRDEGDRSGINDYAGDGGLLDGFDQEFSKGELSIRDTPPHPTTRQLPLRTDQEGRDQEYQKLMAAHERARQRTPYLHAGGEVPDEIGNDWENFLWSRMDPEKKIASEDRADADEAWENSRGRMVAPDAGWDKPKVGRFRSAMSWLGNKLTFGKFGGKDYKSRQADLAKRRGIMDQAFRNQMVYFDEREFDLSKPEADDHEYTTQRFGGQYLGTSGNQFNDRTTPYNNPRYNNASHWIKDSKYGRAKWDRLARKEMGNGYVIDNLLQD